jgi:hypothetical protein
LPQQRENEKSDLSTEQLPKTGVQRREVPAELRQVTEPPKRFARVRQISFA